MNKPRLSAAALAALETAEKAGSPILIPSITLVEISYLVEKGRIPKLAWTRLLRALRDDASALTLAPLDLAVAVALPKVSRATVPDMPDRIIAATALALGLPLVTRDHKIKLSNITSIW
jgi:predicted nucleic acid-binding protein